MSQTEEQKKNLDELAREYIEHLCGEIQCWKCAHYFEDDEINRCEAFPSGIPSEIMYGGIDHRKSYKGDNGIQFKPTK